MKVAVWDTYVERADGKTMHFDILVDHGLKDQQQIFDFGKQYLQQKPFQTGELSTNECKFCHIEQATNELAETISQHGFSIIEIEHCN